VVTSIEELGLSPEIRQAVLDARADIVRYGRKMAADRLVTGSAGNISVRAGDLTVITPSGVDYGEIGEENVCVMDTEGRQVAGQGRPSSEYPMHRMIYDTRNDARAVVHTHSVAAVAASVTCDEIPAVHYAILRLGGPTVRVAPYQTFGSEELAASAADALADRYAALLQNHGAVAYGPAIADAYSRAELVEWLAEVWARSRQLGEPRVLNDAELASVTRQADKRRYAQAAG
jgi:L-fuculose-phosphate aldolase